MRLLRTPLRPRARHQVRSTTTHLHVVPSALVVAAGLVAAVAGTGTANADAPRSVAARTVANVSVPDEATLARVALQEHVAAEKRVAALAAAKAKAQAAAKAQVAAKAKAKAEARAKAQAAARARAAAHAKAVAHANAVAAAKASARPKTVTRATYSAPASHPAVSGAASLNWSALADCEASGNPHAYNAAGYYGLYQFDVRTWQSMGGAGLPSDASASEQTYRAQLLYKQRGSSPWPVCGARLFS